MLRCFLKLFLNTFVATMFFILMLATTVTAQEDPSEDQIQGLVVEQLPIWWRVSEIKIVVVSDIGDAVSPKRAVRFEATSAPAADLFSEINMQGPFVIVVETVKSGTERTIYGVATLTYRAGIWSGEAVIENPVYNLGIPKDIFSNPVLISGSENAQTVLEDLININISGVINRQQREIASLEDAYARKLTELESAYQLAWSEADADFQSRLAEREFAFLEVEAANARKLAELDAAYEQAVSEAETKFEIQLVEKQTEFRENLAQIEAQQGSELNSRLAEMAAAQAEAARRIREIRSSAEREIAQAENAARQRVATLRAELESTDDERRIQREIIASRQQLLNNERLIAEISEQVSARRDDLVASLSGRWTGRVECTSRYLPWYTFSAVYEDTGTGSLIGQFTVTSEATSRFASQVGRPLPSTMSLLSVFGEPIEIGINSQGRISNQLLGLRIGARQDGSFFGQAGENDDCVVTVSHR